MNDESLDSDWMKRALNLALRGQGRVEPNPMVGCVLVKENCLLSEGWHESFGGAHAEVNAIRAAEQSILGCTAYVTLEPCSHTGKTLPCVDALIKAGVSRVVIAHPDPHPLVAGEGIRRLKEAGIDVEIGVEQSDAAFLLAPYLKRVTRQLPWVIAKWAMTWDGKIATSTGDSKWISNEQSRNIVHQIRGRVDAIMVGINTVFKDDPLLTTRPPGIRQATRIVLDTWARTPIESQLCLTAKQVPTLIAVGRDADPERVLGLQGMGCEVWQPLCGTQSTQPLFDENSPTLESGSPLRESNFTPSKLCDSDEFGTHLLKFLNELARREMTNVLVEGGGKLLGTLFDLRQIDELHVFIGGKVIGGKNALSPVAGVGVSEMLQGQSISLQAVSQLDNDIYLIGRTQ